MEEKPKRDPFNNGILQSRNMILSLNSKLLSVEIDLNGERIISSLKVWRPKYEAPILAEIKKNIDTERIDRNVNIQDMGVTRLTRFHAGDLFSGYFDHQY